MILFSWTFIVISFGLITKSLNCNLLICILFSYCYISENAFQCSLDVIQLIMNLKDFLSMINWFYIVCFSKNNLDNGFHKLYNFEKLYIFEKLIFHIFCFQMGNYSQLAFVPNSSIVESDEIYKNWNCFSFYVRTLVWETQFL